MISDYIVARDIKEVLGILGSNPGARILAGGTDSFSHFIESTQNIVVVDISKIEELSRIKQGNGFIEIGAAVTLSRAVETPWFSAKVPSMAEAISRVGSPQIRNQGTVVGNVLSGRAAANARVCTVALGAVLKVKGPNHERSISIEDKMAKGEVAISLLIPHKPAEASSYQCFTPRRSFAYASVSVAASVTVTGGKFQDVSLVGSPILPPSARSDMEPCNSCAGSCRICQIQHLQGLEQDLTGRSASEEMIIRTCDNFDWQAISMRDSIVNGPANHRRQLLKVLSKRALVSALNRQQETKRMLEKQP